jgi:putative tryptophan/tyrosine transport system substrate-binding protein
MNDRFFWHSSHSCYTQRSVSRRGERLMRRREFIGGSASIALWPLGAFAEQAHPRIGFLHQGGLPTQPLIAAFRVGLAEGGASPDIEIEHRPADGDYNRLPALAADLVNRQVSVIAAELLPASLAAKAATKTISIVFLTGSDPIGSGLVSSIASPKQMSQALRFSLRGWARRISSCCGNSRRSMT